MRPVKSFSRIASYGFFGVVSFMLGNLSSTKFNVTSWAQHVSEGSAHHFSDSSAQSSIAIADQTVLPVQDLPVPDFPTHVHVGRYSMPWPEVLDAYRSTPDQNSRRKVHRIAILQVLTPTYAKNYQVPSTSMSCYAAKQGYYYHLEVAQMDYNSPPAINRWRSVAKLLRFYDYLLFVSGDVMPVNFTQTVDEYIGIAPEADLLFPLRFSSNMRLPELGWYHLSTETIILKNSARAFDLLDNILTLYSNDRTLEALWVDMAIIMHVIYQMSDNNDCNGVTNEYMARKRGWSEDILYQQYLACPKFWKDVQDKRLPKFLHVFSLGEFARDLGFASNGPIQHHPWVLSAKENAADISDVLEGNILIPCLDFFVHAKNWEKYVSLDDFHCTHEHDGNLTDSKPFAAISDTEKYLQMLGFPNNTRNSCRPPTSFLYGR